MPRSRGRKWVGGLPCGFRTGVEPVWGAICGPVGQSDTAPINCHAAATWTIQILLMSPATVVVVRQLWSLLNSPAGPAVVRLDVHSARSRTQASRRRDPKIRRDLRQA